MRFPAEIDQVKTLKKGVKIKLAVPDEEMQSVMKNIHNFLDRDLLVDLEVDEAKEEDKLHQITEDQRKKIYALFRDIAKDTGNNKDHIKEQMKREFIGDTDYAEDELSLANCSREAAANFIEWLINFAFEYGIGIQDDPKEYFDDIERAIYICLDQNKCAICGSEDSLEVHHCEGSRIGMGRDRNKVDDSDSYVLPLCGEHHSELHNMSEEDFKDNYHLKCVQGES